MKVKFSDVLEIKNGRNQRQVEHCNGKYPIYGSGGVIGYADSFLCNADTVVIGRKGSINNPIFVTEPFWNVDTAFGLEARRDKLLPRYLFYFCKKFNFEKLNTTVTIPSLTKANLLMVEMQLPPLSEQREVVSMIDKTVELIVLQRQQLELLGLMVKSRFVEMFGDPVTNPMGWEVVRLDRLGELNRGVSKHRPRNAVELLGGKYPLIQTGEVAAADLYITGYTATYSEIGLRQSKMWPKETLCITIAANIAKTAILGFDACFPDSVVGFISRELTNQIFVHFWFSFFQEIIEEQAPESAQKNINLRILGELEVITPPLPLQHRFADFVRAADKSKFEIQQGLAKLELQYNALMQKYFG